ncbi:MAG: hypothetical protein SF066_23615 [Thermoanaerobaculia bacterium]|nr:hypothetical protein [Thermoanaerobaculia bacterium]
MIPNLDPPAAPWQDPIVAELREARERLFVAAGYDLETLGQRLREAQAASGRQVITLPPRRPDGQRGASA